MTTRTRRLLTVLAGGALLFGAVVGRLVSIASPLAVTAAGEHDANARHRASRPAHRPPQLDDQLTDQLGDQFGDQFGDQAAGLLHLHTTSSHDGVGTLPELVAAAGALGLRFAIITEHDQRIPAAPYWAGPVLVVPASESSTTFGHLLVFGTSRPLDRHERSVDPLAAVRSLGGWAAVAHPAKASRPWVGGLAGVDGLEIGSGSSDARHLLTSPGSLFGALLGSMVDGRLAMSYVLWPDPAPLAAWDQILRSRFVAGLCGTDAHGRFGYGRELLGYQLVTFDRWWEGDQDGPAGKVDPAVAADGLLRALRAGRSLCRVGFLGDVRASFAAIDLTGQVHLGGSRLLRGGVQALRVRLALPSSKAANADAAVDALPVEIELLRDGALIATQRGSSLDLAGPQPGTYRAQAFALLPGFWGGTRRVPLVSFNPIVLLAAARAQPHLDLNADTDTDTDTDHDAHDPGRGG